MSDQPSRDFAKCANCGFLIVERPSPKDKRVHMHVRSHSIMCLVLPGDLERWPDDGKRQGWAWLGTYGNPTASEWTKEEEVAE